MKTSHEFPADYSPSPGTSRSAEVPSEWAGWRFDAVLAKLFPEHSRSRLQSWLKDGLIRIDGAELAAKCKVHGGERVEFAGSVAPALEAGNAAEDIAINIRYEDDGIMVIDKPAGLVVHPGNGQPSGTLLNALLHHAPQLAGIPRAGIVHRLDKDTSGLMIIAKSDSVHQALAADFQARRVEKLYLALVCGEMKDDEGIVALPVGRHPVERRKMSTRSPRGKEAVTRWQVRERFGAATLVAAAIETGRTHQIRVHLTSLGYPVVGDRVYGNPKKIMEINDQSLRGRLREMKRQALHASRIAFVHPADGRPLSFSSPLPPDMEDLCRFLRERIA